MSFGAHATGHDLTWFDRWYLWRNRLLADAGFQRKAASSFLTRPFARRSARKSFDLVAGFVYSQVLLSCVRLKVFDLLFEYPRTLPEMAQALGLPQASAERLLLAAAALRLVQPCSRGRYTLGALGAPLARNPAILAMVEHHQAFYQDLADPVALLHCVGTRDFSTRISSLWAYAGSNPAKALKADQVEQYCALMTISQPLVADEVLDVYPLHAHQCLLDIGGGEGEFLMRTGARAPHLKLMLFDLPAVAQRAAVRFGGSTMASRVSTVGGNFLLDALPAGADIATLVRVVHDHDDAEAVKLLKAAHSALTPSGTLLIAEPMADTAGANAMGAAYFGFYLMAMGQGRSRSSHQLTQLLHQAGFSRVRLLPTRMPLQVSVLVAQA
jgi:demethylspheroidene O-methyltransferase